MNVQQGSLLYVDTKIVSVNLKINYDCRRCR